MHLAASLHALAGWRTLAPVNLGGLRHSLRLARRDGAVLQLASTLSVFVSSNAPDADREAPLPERDVTDVTEVNTRPVSPPSVGRCARSL